MGWQVQNFDIYLFCLVLGWNKKKWLDCFFRVRVLPTDDDSGDLDDDGDDDGDKDENDDRFYLSRFPLTELHTAGPKVSFVFFFFFLKLLVGSRLPTLKLSGDIELDLYRIGRIFISVCHNSFGQQSVLLGRLEAELLSYSPSSLASFSRNQKRDGIIRTRSCRFQRSRPALKNVRPLFIWLGFGSSFLFFFFCCVVLCSPFLSRHSPPVTLQNFSRKKNGSSVSSRLENNAFTVTATAPLSRFGAIRL